MASYDDPANQVSAPTRLGDATYVGTAVSATSSNATDAVQQRHRDEVCGDKPRSGCSRTVAHRRRAACGGSSRRSRSTADATRRRSTSPPADTAGAGSRRERSATRTRGSARAMSSSATNGGQTFTDVSGNLPEVPATSVTLRGRQLIVGTDVGVFATNPKAPRATRTCRVSPWCRSARQT